jgi:hypothetical protein
MDSERLTMRCTRAAQELGIRPDLLMGLIIGGHVEGFPAEGKSGKRVWLVYRDEVERLKKHATNGDPPAREGK